MAIEKNIEFQGDRVVNSLGGNIKLNQTTGELIVSKNGVILTKINKDGFVYSEDPKTGAVGEWISVVGEDVIEVLENET